MFKGGHCREKSQQLFLDTLFHGPVDRLISAAEIQSHV